MRSVITLLQKEYLRLLEISINAHEQKFKELYEDIDETLNQILIAKKIINDYSLSNPGHGMSHNNKRTIEEWFASLKVKPSQRLVSVLLPNAYRDQEKPFKYVEDVNVYEFSRLRHAGKVTWNEFVSLRGY